MAIDNQDSLFYESVNDAIKDIIKHLGGNKFVGNKLWPEIAVDKVSGKLSDCLNESRAEKLSPEQFILLLKLGREIGCHVAINYVARECGYADPQPISKEDQAARLQREFIQAAKVMNDLSNRLSMIGLLP